MNGTLSRLLTLAIIAAALPACHVSRPADPTRHATAPLPGPESWPDRDLDAVRGFHQRTPESVRRWELNGLVPEDHLEDESRERLASVDRTIVANRLTDHGLLRVWSYPGHEMDVFSVNWLFGGGFLENAAFLTSRDATGYRLERALEDIPETLGTPRHEKNFHFPGLQQTHVHESVMLGTGIELRIPTEIRGRGVLIVLGGLFSTEWQERSIELFEHAGWDLLRINPASRTRRPNDSEYERVRDQRRAYASDLFQRQSGITNEDGSDVPITEWADRVDPDRTGFDSYEAALEVAKAELPMPPTGFELAPESDPEEVGRTIAGAIDDSIAENAYAAEAGVEYLIDMHGRDALGPLAVIGYSAGSLAAPAVAARLEAVGVPVGAMILIGGGADLFTISQTSRRTNGGVDLTGEGHFTPTPAQVAAARDAYLRHTTLDPYALGPALADIPTLLMIASNDESVPNGELLDERLGEPHRIRYFGGHAGLFYFLPPQTPRIIRWLDRVTAGAR